MAYLKDEDLISCLAKVFQDSSKIQPRAKIINAERLEDSDCTVLFKLEMVR